MLCDNEIEMHVISELLQCNLYLVGVNQFLVINKALKTTSFSLTLHVLRNIGGHVRGKQFV